MTLLNRYFSPAEITGAASLLLACLVFFFAPLLTLCILFVFILCCLLAPFFPEISFFLPIICRGSGQKNSIALTFDDGPSPGSTLFILDILARYNCRATFFIIGKNACQHPELIRKIVDEGHSIGNHSWDHDNLLMFRTLKTLDADIGKTQNVMAGLTVKPRVFRPPVGITGPRLGPVLNKFNMVAVNFSCRAFDKGNRTVDGLADNILAKIRSGDILLLHDTWPLQEEQVDVWKEELEQLIPRLQSRYTIVPLETLTGCSVMERLTPEESTQE
ncbi:MAG: polysaccharide deacetylase family protein [Desulfobulbus sp.]|nr:MAG: polysaccharide deacetylase family protein [Desulfobulbus sp.]